MLPVSEKAEKLVPGEELDDAIAREVSTGQLAITRVRGRRLYRQAGWIYLKSDYLLPPVTAMLELFDSMKKGFRSIISAAS